MKPSRLYIKDFMCYDNAYIDFNEFSAALIVGKKEHNDDISNGVGKTTIFKAIEYVLFNHADINLEDMIRDDTDSCSITIDFEVDSQEYRVTRTRTRKGTSDLTLYKRTHIIESNDIILHSIKDDKHTPLYNDKYWEDISGRRSADTEKDIGKLIKINIKSFRVFVHFMQTDFSGLTTATPEKRKAILRDAMNLIIYPKLEKLAKDKLNLLSKEAEKFKVMIDTLGYPDQSISDLTIKMSTTSQDLNASQAKLADSEVEQNQLSDKISQLINEHSGLESKFANLLAKEQTLNGEKSRLETSVKEYTTRKSNIIAAARDLIAEIKTLEETQLKLVELDFNQIDVLSEQIISNKENAAQINMSIQNDMTRIDKLKKPIPKDGECEGCRQPITEEHRKICQAKLDEELLQCQRNIQNYKKTLVDLTAQNTIHQQEINKLNLSRQHLESVNTKIATKKNETADKRTQHEEYKVLLEKFTTELTDKNKQLEQVAEDLAKSSIDEAKVLRKKIAQEKENLLILTTKATSFHKEIAHLTGAFAVFQHDLNKRVEDRRKKIDYTKLLGELNTKIEMYPSVIQAFSSTGIPNLIIQNVLDDLQTEANTLLAQLKPGIQLSFFVEKTKGDGTESDTLDINYSVNGKKRYYEQLSGAMKLAVTFSLKLGLSFLLQKMAGVDIKFLLLDEIDQSLDKASVDSFADIVKFFQKDFTMLVITHNDRLKDKFSHAILVEQDINMVSRARVVSTW